MGHGAHSHKKNGLKSPQGFPHVPKHVLFFVINQTTYVNRFPHAYTGENFFIFCEGVFPDAQNSPKYSTLG